MKKIMYILCLALCLAAMLSACGSGKKQTTGSSAAAEETLQNGYPASKQPDPTAPKLAGVVIYLPGKDGKLSGEMDAVAELNAESLLDKLVELGVVKQGVQLLSYDTEQVAGETVQAGPGAAADDSQAQKGKLTLSGFAAGAACSSDEQAKEAVQKTFIENFSLQDCELVLQ